MSFSEDRFNIGGQTFASSMMDLSHLRKETQEHLSRVYGALAATTATAALAAYLALTTFPWLMGFGIMLPLVGLGLIFMLRGSRSNQVNQPTSRWMMLLGFGATTGIGMAPLIGAVMTIDPMLPMTAFLMASLVFGVFSMTALRANERQYLALGGLLGSGLLTLLAIGILNIFIRSSLMFSVYLWLGVLVFSGFVVFDTQLIIARHRFGDADYLMHATDLFLDLANLFQRILVILAKNKDSDRKNTKRR